MIKLFFLFMLFIIILYFVKVFRILFRARQDFNELNAFLNRRQSRLREASAYPKNKYRSEKVYEMDEDEYKVEK